MLPIGKLKPERHFVRSRNARDLAAKFATRFPEVAASGAGRDWEYAGWLVELLDELERQPDILPITVAENLDTPALQPKYLPLRRYGDPGRVHDMPSAFPLPPPSLA